MWDTPPQLRGELYATHMTHRCLQFHQCKRCSQCANYNPHEEICRYCESRKPGGMHCQCSDERQLQVVLLEELLNRPLWHPDQKPSDICQAAPSTAWGGENTRIADSLYNAIEEK